MEAVTDDPDLDEARWAEFVQVYKRVQLEDNTLCFPCQSMPLLNKHSLGSDVLWQRGPIVVVSAWQRDSGQNTAMTVSGERKEEQHGSEINWK